VSGTSLLTLQSNKSDVNDKFLDSSTNNFLLTRNGNTVQNSFSPYGSNWSNYFGGGSLSVPNNSALLFGSGNFTVEAWVYRTGTSGSWITGFWSYTNPGNQSWAIYYDGGYGFNIQGDQGAEDLVILYTANSAVQSQWTHVAVTRSGSSWRMFINGIQTATATYGGTLATPGNNLGIGVVENAPSAHAGYISNLRIVKGTAIYTSNFTPSTEPLTAVSGTSLLTCQSNRFKDNSTNNFAITLSGTANVLKFSPFRSSTAYTPESYSGSAYFDGNGDYLNITSQTALNLGTSNFTIELWFYDDGSSLSYPTLLGNATGWTSGSFSLRYNNTGHANKVGVHLNPSDPLISSTNTFASRSWHHVALTRSGNTYTLYVDGTVQGSATQAGNFNLGFGGTNIGWSAWDGAQGYYKGYVTDVRVVSGTVLYNSAFVPPTSPLTVIPNTQLLCKFADAGFVDNSMNHRLTTTGSPRVSSVVKKYGTGSMYFPGSNSYISIPNDPKLYFGSGDYTVEAWVYPQSFTGVPAIVGMWSTVLAGEQAWMLYIESSLPKFVIDPEDTVILTSSTALQLNTWQHVAVTKSGTAFKMFINGIVVASATQSHSMRNASGDLEIGDVADGGTHDYVGYIDDLRITRGYARYTANFTPPGKLPAR
jgi:hypothetical protein